MEKIIVTTQGELETLIQNTVRKALSEQTDKKQDAGSQIFSLTQAASFLQLAKQTLYGYTSKRKIPFIKKGKKLYFRESDLEKWLEAGRKKSRSEISEELTKNTGK